MSDWFLSGRQFEDVNLHYHLIFLSFSVLSVLLTEKSHFTDLLVHCRKNDI